LVKQTQLLDVEIKQLRFLAYSENTHAAYSTHIKAFIAFCHYFRFRPVPAENQTILRYVVFLSRTIKPQSIRCYLSVIRILHLENGYKNPLEYNYLLTTLLKGIDSHRGTPPVQKLPITLELLSKMFKILNLNDSFELCFWAACLVGFFTFFRKSTLLTKSHSMHDCRRDLCRNDVQFCKEGAVINVKYSKTMRDFTKTFPVPIPQIPGSHLCPASALIDLMQAVPAGGDAPLFSYISRSKTVCLSHCQFSSFLKITLTKLGLDSTKYSGHSLRRAGATFALACGLPPQVIKSQGGWASDCYMRYTDVPLNLRVNCAKVLGEHALKTPLPT